MINESAILEKHKRFQISATTSSTGINTIHVFKNNGMKIATIDNSLDGVYKLRYACYECVSNPSELKEIAKEICELYNNKK